MGIAIEVAAPVYASQSTVFGHRSFDAGAVYWLPWSERTTSRTVGRRMASLTKPSGIVSRTS